MKCTGHPAIMALAAVAILLLSQAAPAEASHRVSAHRQVGKTTLSAPRAPLMAMDEPLGLSVTDLADVAPEDLVATLLSDATVPFSSVRYTGSITAAGLFSGGSEIVGFENGLILSTGYIRNVIGPNQYDDITGQTGQPGDTSLGAGTEDAAILEFDFVPESDSITFQYVFASEEYNEWANSGFNDVFGFYVNGVNRALVPGLNLPVSVNTINGGNPVGVDPQNQEYFINNEVPYNTLSTEMDGLTTVLTLQSPVNRGQTNHLKLAIADVGDDQWDSNVFIKAGSFTDITSAAPQTRPIVAPAPNAAGWNNASISVTLSALMTGPGTVQEIHFQIGTAPEIVAPGARVIFPIDAEGTTTITYYAVSSQGVVEASKRLSVQIDKVPPTISGAPYRAPNAYGWFNSDVPVGFTCADLLSGLVNCLGYITLGEGAGQTVFGSATDKAGNTSTAMVSGINVDETAPDIEAVLDRLPDMGGWYNAPVQVTFTCQDGLSGISACTAAVILSGDGRDQAVSGDATDKAGNTATGQVTVNIDGMAPAIVYAGQKSIYMWDEQVNITCSATDNLSGVAFSDCTPISWPASSFGTGQHTFTASATDFAGNTGTGSVTFTVTAPPEGTCALIDQWVTHHGVANSLCVKIRNAMAAKERGSYGAAFNLLEAFKQEVEAQADKHILPGGKEVLLEFANTLEADLPPIPPDDRDKKNK